MLSKKMLISILMLGAVMCIASAGTWAYFDSSQTVTGNQITTGEIKLDVINQFYNKPPLLVPMVAENVMPGDIDVRINPIPARAKNIGSIDGVLSLKIVPSDEDDGSLSKYLMIKATTSPDPGEGQTVILWDGTSTGLQEICDLDFGKGEYIYYIYSFPDDGHPQNEAQGKTFKFNVEYSLKQK